MAIRYPERVTRGEDGVYRWTGNLGERQNVQNRKIVLIACGASVAPILILCAVSFPDMLGVTLASCLAALGVALGIALLMERLPGSTLQRFEMTEDYVRWVGTGRTDFYFRYERLTRVDVYTAQCRIVLRKPLSWMPLVAPREDFSFVRDHILHRLSAKTKVQLH